MNHPHFSMQKLLVCLSPSLIKLQTRNQPMYTYEDQHLKQIPCQIPMIVLQLLDSRADNQKSPLLRVKSERTLIYQR